MDIDGWKVDIDSLPGPNRKKLGWAEDRLYHCKQTDIACLIYSIAEFSMGWNVGKLAIYRNQRSPELILNPEHLLCLGVSDTVKYADNGELGFVNLYVYHEQNLECPVCILDFIKKKFTVLPIINGFNYNLIESGLSQYKLMEKKRDDRFNSFTGKEIDLNKLPWFDWELLSDFPTWYFDNEQLVIL
jgi:hypothetical protein